MKADKWVKRWKVNGSNGNDWTVAIDKDGNYGCSCPVWKFKREECHHILQVKENSGQEENIKYRNAGPGNVGEVTIKEDDVLYPLVPFGGNFSTDLAATIIFDLQRANVNPQQIKDYKDRMFKNASMKQIISHVEERGRLIYSEWIKGQGWIDPVYVYHNTPLKERKEAP